MGIGVIYLDTSFIDNRDRDEFNPILLKFPDTVNGPALLQVHIKALHVHLKPALRIGDVDT